MKNKKILAFLNHIKGIGWKTISNIVHQMENLEDLFQMESLELSVKCHIHFSYAEKIIIQLKDFAEFESLYNHWESTGVKIISFYDSSYPEQLKEINQPPWILYIKGNFDLLNRPKFAIVGTRKPTSYGKMVAEKYAKELAAYGFVIVSGLARGIDQVSHEGALMENRHTIAVLGNGINVIYPKENRNLYQQIANKGLILSEYAPDVEPHPGMFPQRNRIISGLSHGVLVIEASERSGSLITAQHALEQSREVFAIPGPITSKQSIGTNTLIQEGAKLVQDIKDILDEFSYIPIDLNTPLKQQKEELNRTEQKVYHIIDIHPTHIDDIYEKVELSLSELYQALMTLQLKEKVKQLPGSNYVKLL